MRMNKRIPSCCSYWIGLQLYLLAKNMLSIRHKEKRNSKREGKETSIIYALLFLFRSFLYVREKNNKLFFKKVIISYFSHF